MADPIPVVRQLNTQASIFGPTASLLRDGFRSLITIANHSDIAFWEKTVKPPGLDGGDAIEETTMHNLVFRTKAPRALKTVTDLTTTVAYDPAVYQEISRIINVPVVFTVNFSDTSLLAFWGYLQKFEPSDMKEGEQPEATITIVSTNTDGEFEIVAGNKTFPESPPQLAANTDNGIVAPLL